MAFLGLGDPTLKKSLIYWVPRLAKAQANLWNHDLDKARRLYAQILKELETIKPEIRTDDIAFVEAEARLGEWAIRYIKDPAGVAPEYQEILKDLPTASDLWLFVAKVLGWFWDTGTDALAVYKKVLQLFPTAKTVESAVRLLVRAPIKLKTVEVLEEVAWLVPEDDEIVSWFFRWAIKAGADERAETFAKEILARFPDKREAWRCLGYLAEIQQKWEEASGYYLRSQDWLRLAVCQNFAGNPWASLQTLEKIDPAERDDPVWLYHNGWAICQTGKPELGVSYWREMQKQDPVLEIRLAPLISVVQRRRYYDYLETNTLFEKPLPDGLPEDYLGEAYLRQGAMQLLVFRKPSSAEETLKKAIALLPMAPLARIYLEASLASKYEDMVQDKRAYDQFRRTYGDASLFMLIRSLWLAPIRPVMARSYLDKAIQKGVSRHLPEDALAILLRLIDRMSRQQAGADYLQSTVSGRLPFITESVEVENESTELCLEQEIPHDLRGFLYAAGPVAVIEILTKNKAKKIPWVTAPLKQGSLMARVNWNPIQAVYLASQGEWKQALDAARGSLGQLFDLDIINHWIVSKGEKQEWQQIVGLLKIGVEKDPKNPAYVKLYSGLSGVFLWQFWLSGDYSAIVRLLKTELASNQDDPRIHRNLAVAYTHWAIHQDMLRQEGSSFDLWSQAIHHWAITVSNNLYWETWRKGRSKFYGDEAKWLLGETPSVDDLLNERIPNIFRAYFREQENQAGPDQTIRFRDYLGMFEQNLVRFAWAQEGKKGRHVNDLESKGRLTKVRKAMKGNGQSGWDFSVYKLGNNNPYLVLDLPFKANQQAITQAFTEKNRNSELDRQVIRQAYDSLRTPEERVLVDALLPDFPGDQEAVQAIQEFSNQLDPQKDWLDYLDQETIERECLSAFTEAVVRHFFRKVSPPADTLELLPDFNGLEKFAEGWLKEKVVKQ